MSRRFMKLSLKVLSTILAEMKKRTSQGRMQILSMTMTIKSSHQSGMLVIKT